MRTNTIRAFWLAAYPLAAFLASPLSLGAQGFIPNECCPDPVCLVWRDQSGADEAFLDAGEGPTPVGTYGNAERHVRMPRLADGMLGMAALYHGMLKVNVNYSAWQTELTSPSLFGGDLPVPHLTAADLAENAQTLQPRPGTMPGLYLYRDNETGWFYHYGSPIESGANPQTTAIYKPDETGGGTFAAPGFAATTIVHTNNLSGAQLWYYGDASTPYVEVKHVDGTIAQFESFNPYRLGYTPSGELWRLVEVRDPYDNTATYVWGVGHKLEQIQFPSGLVQTFDYTPWVGWSSSFDCLKVSYSYPQSSTSLPARTWGLVFSGTLGTSGGKHFGSRLYRTYSAARDVLLDPTPGTPHAISGSSTVSGQIVHEFAYVVETTSRYVLESQSVHTGSAFASTLTASSNPETEGILKTSFLPLLPSGPEAGRVLRQERLMTGEALQCSYPMSGFRNTDLLPTFGIMRGIEVEDDSDTVRRFEYDYDFGHLYRIVTTPSLGTAGRPRANASSIGGISVTDVEPTSITVDNDFDGACVCQKPIKVRVSSVGGSANAERVTNFEYFLDSKLLKKRSEPNPQTGSGQVHWEYTYTRAMGSGQAWGAWLIASETTPDGVYTYSYPAGGLLNRADATNHGQIAGTVERSLAGVRIQASLTLPPSTSSVPVVETMHRNLPNSPGGQSGGIKGLPRRTIDGDGVTTTFEYSTEGWLTTADAHGGAVRTTWSHDPSGYGDVSSMIENATSTGHQATTTFTVMHGVGVPGASESSSGGVVRKSETYFDRWGHVAVERRYNRASNGSKPTNHDGSATNARDWVEEQYHYQHQRLVETFRDRERLDLPAGAGQFLHTELIYENGRLSRTINPNGSVTWFVFDGYGTLYHSYVKDSGGTVTVARPKRFVNPFLEVTGTYENDGSTGLWTLIGRNGAGAITQITEPKTAAPPGYTQPAGGGEFSTGGARHVFTLDVLGRVVKTETFEDAPATALLLAMREMRYDQLGRQIWQHDEARLRDINAGSVSVAGDHHVAWKYRAGTASQLETVERTGVAPLTYSYFASGFLERLRDGFSSGNLVEYAYHTGTPFVSLVTRKDLDPAGGTRTSTTAYDADPFGRTTAIREGSPQLVHAYAYDSLGHVDRYTDPASKVQKFLPDAMGRIVEHVRYGGGSDRILNKVAYDDTSANTTVTRRDDLNHVTVTHFDFAGRPFIVQNPGGNTAPSSSSPNQPMCLYAEYDGASRVKFIYDGEGARTDFYRDGMGRVIQREMGNFVGTPKITLWNTKDVFRRDAIGRIAQTDYWGGTHLGNPPHGILWAVGITSEDSIGRTHKERFHFATAPANPLEVVSGYGDGSSFRSSLDYADNLTGSLSGYSQPLQQDFTKDSIGRLSTIAWDKAGTSTAMNQLASYDWVGGLRRFRNVRYQDATNPRGFTTFSYDAYGRGIQIKDDVSNGAGVFTTKSQFDYEYNAASNLLKEKYTKVDGSAGDRFAYDAYHRLTTAWMGVNSVTMAATDDPTGFSAAMHEQLTYGLDKANNRTSLNSTTAAGTLATSYTVQGSTHAQGPSNRYDLITTSSPGVTQEYDNRGNLTYDGRFYYVYDYMNRLQEVLRVVPGGAMMMQQGEAFAVEEGALEDARQEIHEKVPDLKQRALREHMDPTFRARLKVRIRGGVTRLQPTTSGGLGPFADEATLELYAIYIYDGFNRRTITAQLGFNPTQFHTWDGWRQVEQYTLAATPETGAFVLPEKQFVWGSQLDELIAYRRRLPNGTWENYYVLHGGQDTAAKLVDEDGSVVEQYEYDPYGKVTVYDGSGNLVDLGEVGSSPEDGQWSALGLPFLWKAIRLDHETGLLYMRNRYYSTATGRFLTRDPIGTWGDVGNMGNECAYAGNSPLTRSDPLGLQAPPQPVFPKNIGHPPGERQHGILLAALDLLLDLADEQECTFQHELHFLYLTIYEILENTHVRAVRHGSSTHHMHGGMQNLPDLSTEPVNPHLPGAVNVFNSSINGIEYNREMLDSNPIEVTAAMLAHEAVHVHQDIDMSDSQSTIAAELEGYSIEYVVLLSIMQGGCGELDQETFMIVSWRLAWVEQTRDELANRPNTPDLLGFDAYNTPTAGGP